MGDNGSWVSKSIDDDSAIFEAFTLQPHHPNQAVRVVSVVEILGDPVKSQTLHAAETPVHNHLLICVEEDNNRLNVTDQIL